MNAETVVNKVDKGRQARRLAVGDASFDIRGSEGRDRHHPHRRHGEGEQQRLLRVIRQPTELLAQAREVSHSCAWSPERGLTRPAGTEPQFGLHRERPAASATCAITPSSDFAARRGPPHLGRQRRIHRDRPVAPPAQPQRPLPGRGDLAVPPPVVGDDHPVERVRHAADRPPWARTPPTRRDRSSCRSQ